MNPAVKMAYAIVDLQEEVNQLKDQVERLTWFKEQYHLLLDRSIKHNDHMMHQQLGLVLALCESEGLAGVQKAVQA